MVRGRRLGTSATAGAADILQPLLTMGRGLRVLAVMARCRWTETPSDRRGPALFLVASCALVVMLLPYGPLLALIALMAAAGWAGRRAPASTPTAVQVAAAERLQTLYEALVPYFSVPEDQDPLYRHDGQWPVAFEEHAFDQDGRLLRLRLRYPPYFKDGEPEARGLIEQLLYAKSGRGREYLFDWHEEDNRLEVSVLAPLSTGIHAQRFVATPGEAVLGFTDPTGVARTLPVLDGEESRDAPPVVWRTGPRSTEPHLLALGQPGSGTTTLLRSLALQALHHGDVLVLDGCGGGEYACLTGRAGVLAVECGLTGVLATLEWAAHETERRLIAANRARQLGHPVPDDIRRPLWLLLDRPTVLSQLAAADGRTDPQELLHLPLRHGRAAHITVVVAEQLDCHDALSEPVRSHTRARVVLGPASYDQINAVLGAPPHTTPTREVPPGRGYARLGGGPVHRLQVPATPDPHDDEASETQRRAVLELLPERTIPGEDAAPAEADAAEADAATPQPVTVEAAVGQQPADGDGPLPVQTP
ncbi:hypothetical protein LRS74_05010 [Streptomyces sp. LX-29]|uniref:hypothetical protein n=1 Tax=Streptomyces sp. LX-29 TaxID=2900152 RepID=UPI00240E68BD|nr:hypothetical protein [Streptomyces sp. LX-29]WFB11472.1 hypothetical protein LRS74_05010 [Streptomyces sp. LX-29]